MDSSGRSAAVGLCARRGAVHCRRDGPNRGPPTRRQPSRARSLRNSSRHRISSTATRPRVASWRRRPRGECRGFHSQAAVGTSPRQAVLRHPGRPLSSGRHGGLGPSGFLRDRRRRTAPAFGPTRGVSTQPGAMESLRSLGGSSSPRRGRGRPGPARSGRRDHRIQSSTTGACQPFIEPVWSAVKLDYS